VATRNIGNGLGAILACTLREDEKCADAHFTRADRARLVLAHPHVSINGSCGASCGPDALRVSAKRGARNVR